MVYCTKCGAKNEEDAAVCVKCGASLVTRPTGRPERRRTEEECFGLPHGGAIAGLIIGIIIILVGVSWVTGFEWELISGNASRQYNNASIEEILRFASKGTEIALEILSNDRTRNGTWETDAKIVDSINERIRKHLISDRERHLGLHFVCNSTFLMRGVEIIIREILNQQIDGRGRGILEFLYEIERTGNFGEALQHFSKEYRQYL